MRSPISQRTKRTNEKAFNVYFYANQYTMKKPRKPFRETKFAAWLKEHDSELFEFAASRIKGDKPVGRLMKALLITLANLTDEKRSEGLQIED